MTKGKKKFLSFFLAMAMTFSSICVPGGTAQAADANVAQGKTVTVSSVENAVPGNTGDQAVDGSTSTRWSSERMKNDGATDASTQTPQWLVIDLSAEKTNVSEIKISFYIKVWATKYQIQTADTNTGSTEWETVKSVERASGSLSDNPVDTFTDVTSLKRYVRFYFEKINVNAGGTGVSVTEISIKGTQEGAITPSQPQLDIVGSELENVVSNDGTYSEWNIGERDVVVIVKNASGTKNNQTVTVPDHSANYPEEWFPVVDTPNAKPEVIPTIQEWYGYEGFVTLTEDSAIIINDAANVGLEKIAENMKADVEEISGISLEIKEGTKAGRENDIYIESLTDTEKYDLGEEGYLMVTNEDGIQIYAPTYTGCIFGTITVEQILWMDEAHAQVPMGIMRDYPAYEVRGLQLDIARTPYRYEQLKDYAKIMLWYKMNEYGLHINDNDNANIQGATNESHSGFHRLESEEFPSLISETKHVGFPAENVNADYYNNNEDYQGNPTYTKEQWRDLTALTEDYGLYLLTEIDLPAHSLLYNKYADENPDNIEWLEGGIRYPNSQVSSWGNMTNGGIELMDLTGANKERALQFGRTLWDEYTRGDEPTIYGDVVHIGADEYWVHDPETHNAFAKYSDEMRKVIQGNLGEDTKIRMWGAGTSSFSTATSVLGMSSAELAKHYQLDIWSVGYDNPAQRIAEGYEIVNCRDAFVYGNPGRTNRDVPNAEYLFNDWHPTNFGGNNPLMGEPNLLGAKAVIWGDQSQEGMTEKDIHQRVLQAIAIISEKTWNGTDEDDTFAEWEIRKSHLAEGPGTQIAMKIDSVSSLVLDYDFANISEDGSKIYDASGNGYDAVVTGGSVKDGWMSFDGEALIETPLKTLSYPYTVSFDLKLSKEDGAANTKESSLFSGYDGRIQVAGFNGNFSADVNYFTRNFGYKVPTNGTEVAVTLVGTLHGTKLYVNGELVSFLSQKADADGLAGNVTSLYSSVLLPLEKIGQDFNGQMANLKVYNKALSAEEIAGADDGKVNVAQNTHAGSSSYKSGDVQDNGEQRTRTSMKVLDGDAFKVQADVNAQPDTNTSDIYSYWKGDHADSALTIDLGTEREISEVSIQWRYGGKGKDMNILTSTDGETWEVTKQVTGNQAFFQTVTFDKAVTTRYIKVQGVSSNSSNGYMIQEFMAYEKVNKDSLNTVLAQAEEIAGKDGLGFENTTNAGKTLFEAVVFARAMSESPLSTIAEVAEAEAALNEALMNYENSAIQGVTRLSGTTRYETGYKVADALKETLGVDKFEAVVIATGKNFADALAGSYLAVEKNAPIILTNGKSDNIAQLHDYIKANVVAGGKVYILGGEGAVPAAVEAIQGYDVVRLAGKSRYDTNIAILEEAGVTGDSIIVATGKSFADSLSASAAKLPILLVKPGEKLSDDAKAMVKGMKNIYIIGGEGAVSADIAKELAAYGTVTRVAGKSRYETSVAVANTFFGSVDNAVAASGKNFPDGLCGGPLAAAMDAPLILTADGKTEAAAGYMAENAIQSGYVLGGTGALADESVVEVFALENADEIVMK